jgi:hypothetical protein
MSRNLGIPRSHILHIDQVVADLARMIISNISVAGRYQKYPPIVGRYQKYPPIVNMHKITKAVKGIGSSPDRTLTQPNVLISHLQRTLPGTQPKKRSVSQTNTVLFHMMHSSRLQRPYPGVVSLAPYGPPQPTAHHLLPAPRPASPTSWYESRSTRRKVCSGHSGTLRHFSTDVVSSMLSLVLVSLITWSTALFLSSNGSSSMSISQSCLNASKLAGQRVMTSSGKPV